MTVTLYSSVKCPWAGRAWLALLEANIEFELVEIDLSVPREPWYLKEINPIGKVPAIKWHDGTVICESAVCAEFVADVAGKLLPSDPLSRSKTRFFIETFTAKFPPALYSALSGPREQQREKLTAAVSTVNSLLETLLLQGPYLLGSQDFTLAEVDCVPFLARFDMLGRHGLFDENFYNDLRSNPRYHFFNSYLDSCLKRPSHIEIWDETINLQSAQARLDASNSSSDYIFLQDLRLIGKAGLSAFSFPDRAFPLVITASVKTKPVQPGSDEYSLSYGDVCREITGIVENGSFSRLEHLAAALFEAPKIKNALRHLLVEKEGGVLRAEKETFEVDASGAARSAIMGLRVGCIIGIYPHEREKKQDVVIDFWLTRDAWADLRPEDDATAIEEYKRTMIDAIATYVEESSFKTVEALAQKICELSFDVLPDRIYELEVKISKPSALTFAKHSGVSITRRRDTLARAQ